MSDLTPEEIIGNFLRPQSIVLMVVTYFLLKPIIKILQHKSRLLDAEADGQNIKNIEKLTKFCFEADEKERVQALGYAGRDYADIARTRAFRDTLPWLLNK